eukprot:TRINITY_DN75357_c0_g1_i1.p1 TRINITY_DN75357_c0_g1~~TRINITY_DN75357_c0_g1_i1.p1  ORF type:complete len:190 (+),score=14.48 TRINITY_DN75357_c0_g1_i1:76-645(+)
MPILSCIFSAVFSFLVGLVGSIESSFLTPRIEHWQNDGTTFSADLPFVKSVRTPAELAELTRRSGKPGMAVVRTTHCPVCRKLVKEMNRGKSSLAKFMSKVVAVDIGDGFDHGKWKAHHGYSENYVPRVYFMNTNGSFVDIFAPRKDKYKYSFWKTDQLQKGIANVLRMHTNQSSWRKTNGFVSLQVSR